MTKLQSFGRFTLASKSRSNCAGIPSLAKISCALFLLYAATAIGAAAQTFTTLVNFDVTNGSGPLSPLTQGTDGNFYGTTGSGGKSSACGGGCGTIFQMTIGGALTTLFSFNGADGAA